MYLITDMIVIKNLVLHYKHFLTHGEEVNMDKVKSVLVILLCHRLCLAEERPDCDNEISQLSKNFEEYVPTLKPVDQKKIAIIWKHMVGDISMTCLESVELLDGNSKTLAREDNMEQIMQMKPFIRNIDICKEYKPLNKKSQIKIKFKDSKSYAFQSSVARYKVPDYFLRKELPPYCISNKTMEIALMHKMSNPEVYKNCFKKVEVCDCYGSEHECYNGNCKYYENDDATKNLIIQRPYPGSQVKMIRLTYIRVNAHTYNGLTSETIYIKLIQGHCDTIFTVTRIGNANEDTKLDKDKRQESSSLNLPLILTIVGCLLVSLISLAICLFVKKKKAENVRKEDVDINPDYGYDVEGAEYERSAIRDANVY